MTNQEQDQYYQERNHYAMLFGLVILAIGFWLFITPKAKSKYGYQPRS